MPADGQADSRGDAPPAAVVRAAFEALAAGDLARLLELVDPALEWTYLDPDDPDPQPQVCRGRDELRRRLGEQGASITVEEIVPCGQRAVVVTRVPGLDARRARATGDRNFHVVTVHAGRVAALRACRSRFEAVAIATSEPVTP